MLNNVPKFNSKVYKEFKSNLQEYIIFIIAMSNVKEMSYWCQIASIHITRYYYCVVSLLTAQKHIAIIKYLILNILNIKYFIAHSSV